MSKPSSIFSPRQRWARKILCLQIAMQAGVAIAPFYTFTVHASSKSDQDMLGRSAQHLSVFGQAAQDNNLSNFASQQANAIATQEIQQWLQNYGTARIELGTDNRFKPHTGAADLLLPLYASPERLFFTQNGLRNVGGQFTGNFGLGQRHFSGDWMFGYNAFYDQNFSRGHKRVGSGVEAWRDYLKLSGNGYYRLSNWRNSVDVKDYDARPANGFDLRAEAWLPAYPALGGRLMYEQYYGQEVALFGKDQRQRNPNAVTAGLSWTPVPLVSFTADHKKGGSQSESTFGLQLSWQLGQSLASQLSSSNVDLKRTLAGSGMDLVERNNNIVLEYRKQQLIELMLPKEITGISGSTQPLDFKLTSKYGLAKIVWNDAAIVAAGGKVEDLGAGRYQLVLPKYVPGTANTHVLSGVAHDKRGNVSKTSSMSVKVTHPAVSTEKSTITTSHDTILADGKATSLITLNLVDDGGMPVVGLAADLSVSLTTQLETTTAGKKGKSAAKIEQAPAQPATLGAISEVSEGVYSLLLTAGTRPATSTVTPALGKQTLAAATIKQISDAASAIVKEGDVQLILNNVVANGTSANSVKARVTDAIGNPVAGVVVNFTLSGSAQVSAGSSLSGVSDANGFVTLQFTDTIAEEVTITVATANGGSAQIKAKFIADSSTAKLADGSLSADRTTAVADGNDKITFRANVTDANGNAVPGVTINWQANGGNLSSSTSTTGADGSAEIVLTSLQAQHITLNAQLNGSTLNAAPVSFTADSNNLDPARSTLNATPSTIVADGAASSVITLSLQDRNGNPAAGQSVLFNPTLAGSIFGSVTDHGDGTYSANLTGTTAGIEHISASINGTAFGAAPASVTLTADSNNLDPTRSTLNASPPIIVANGSAASVISLNLQDRHGNPVAGQNVTFSSTLTGSSFGAVTDHGNGTYSANLTGTLAGSDTITANIGGNAFGAAAASVTLTADSANIDPARSSLSAAPSSIVADGNAVSVISLSLQDRNGNPVAGQNVTFSTALAGSHVGAVTDHGNGTYSANLTGTTAGVESISARIGGSAFGVAAANVTLTADANNLDPSRSVLGATPSTIMADGKAASVISFSLKDRNGNPAAGQNITFTTTLAGSNIGPVTDHGNGTYSANLVGTTAGNESITARIGGNAFGVAPVNVTLTADASNLDPTGSVLSAAPSTIVADGSTASVISLSLQDRNGNPVAGQNVTFTTTLVGSNVGAVTDHGDGTYSASLTGTTAGAESITARIGGNAFGVAATNVNLMADASNLDPARSALSAAPSTIVANGSAASVIQFSLQDRHGNPVAGQIVTFSTALAGSSVGTVTDHGDGTYSANLTGTTAGNESIRAIIGGNAFAVAAASVTLTADSSNLDPARSTLSASPTTIVANGSATSVITLNLQDRHGNPVTGQNVTFGTTLSGNSVGTTTDHGDGTYSASLSGTTAGDERVTARIGGNAFGAAAAAVTMVPGALDESRSLLAVNKATINADDRTGSVITFTARDANNNAIKYLDITFASDLTGAQITSVVNNNNGTYSANLSSTVADVANISVQSSGSNLQGLSAAVTITPGAWNSNQATPLVDVTQQITNCFAQNNVYKRRYVTIFVNNLYDNHGNIILGKINYNNSAASTVDINSQTDTINASSGTTKDSGTNSSWHKSGDSYATEAQCQANRIVTTHITVNVTSVTDDFKTTTVNKTFKLGNGSPKL